MRMSRLMGLASAGMTPDSVTSAGGALQYWSSAASTSDGWVSGQPYASGDAYFGRGSSKPYYNAAVCFKTGSFYGSGRHLAVKVTVQQTAWSNGVAFAAQLSKHGWSTADMWAVGSKAQYSASMTSLPDDANAVARTTGIVPMASGNQAVTLEFNAQILPNTEYVIYVIGTSDVAGELVTIKGTGSNPLSITVTE